MTLFGRQVAFAVGTAADKGRLWSDLRIDFKVTHKLGARGTAEITVHNIPADVAELARGPDTIVRLFAGYDEAPLIFQGTPVDGSIRLTDEGPERKLKLEAQDGGRALAATHLNLSVSSGQSVRQVADRVIDQLGLPRGTVEVPDELGFPQGFHATGRAEDVMRRLSRATGADWSIQDGAVQVVPDDGDTGRRGVVFSSADGTLVGRPEPKDKGLQVTGLLRPALRPGDVYRIEGPDTEGFYKARTVKMRGSRFKQEFYTVALGEEYPV